LTKFLRGNVSDKRGYRTVGATRDQPGKAVTACFRKLKLIALSTRSGFDSKGTIRL